MHLTRTFVLNYTVEQSCCYFLWWSFWRWAGNCGHFPFSPKLTGPVISSEKKWNVPFHLTKLLSSVLLFCILLTRTITKHAVAWVRSVQSEFTVPLGTWNFRNFKPEFLLNGKRPGSKFGSLWNSPSVQFNTICHFTNQKEIGSS